MGNLLGATPAHIANLDIPVIPAEQRANYATNGRKVIDFATGIMIWYKSSRRQWIKVSDGKPI